MQFETRTKDSVVYPLYLVRVGPSNVKQDALYALVQVPYGKARELLLTRIGL